MKYHLYIGAYTHKLPYVQGKGKGIYHGFLDSLTGKIENIELACRATNPSFLAADSQGRCLYAVNELFTWRGRPGGAITAHAIELSSGRLHKLNQRSSGGVAPCYLNIDPAGRFALAANYESGSVALLPIRPDGSLGKIRSLAVHEGRGPHPVRQEKAHAHSIQAHPEQPFALAADLGIDRLVVYYLHKQQLSLHSQVALHPGAGPRHLAFHPSLPIVYVTNELDSSLSVFQLDPDTASLEHLQTCSTLPEGYRGDNTAADIHIHPGGCWLYVSNRGHDSLAAFRIEASGRLEATGHYPSQGLTPRNFAITPDGKFLLVANQDSNNIVNFHIEEQSGKLKTAGEALSIQTPVNILIVPKTE